MRAEISVSEETLRRMWSEIGVTTAKGRTGGAQEGTSTFDVGYRRHARPRSTSLKTLAKPFILFLNVGDLGREHSQG
jgi:hypothetical protein